MTADVRDAVVVVKDMEADEQKGVGETETFESRRLQILRASIESVVKKEAYSVSSEKIIEIARNVSVNQTLTRRQEKLITQTWLKVRKLYEDLIKDDINEYLASSGVSKVLNTMSEMFPEKNLTSVAAWRPTGCPRQDMRSHEAENQIKHNERLQELLDKQEAEIQYLRQHVLHRRLHTHNLMREISKLQNDCRASCADDTALLLHNRDLSKDC